MKVEDLIIELRKVSPTEQDEVEVEVSGTIFEVSDLDTDHEGHVVLYVLGEE